MRESPDTVRGRLAKGRDRDLYDQDGHKPPGRAPMPDRIMVGAIRWWMSKSPTEFGYKKTRWQCKMVQQMIRKNLDMSRSAHTVRHVMHLIRFSYRKSRPAPAGPPPRSRSSRLMRGPCWQDWPFWDMS